jgi:hypothetical protein
MHINQLEAQVEHDKAEITGRNNYIRYLEANQAHNSEEEIWKRDVEVQKYWGEVELWRGTAKKTFDKVVKMEKEHGRVIQDKDREMAAKDREIEHLKRQLRDAGMNTDAKVKIEKE